MYLSKNETRDVVRLAECFILQKQFHRASTLLKRQGLDQPLAVSGAAADTAEYLEGIYLAARAAFESGDLKEAAHIIDNGNELYAKTKEDISSSSQENKTNQQMPLTGKFTRSQGATAASTPKPADNTLRHRLCEEKVAEDRKLLSSIYLLKGQVLEAMDNRSLAAEAFQEAVRIDVYCHEAFKALVKHNLLSGACNFVRLFRPNGKNSAFHWLSPTTRQM